MRMSSKRRQELYGAIRDSIMDIRIELKLMPNQDHSLAQVENKIWAKQKKVLGLSDHL